MSKQFSPFKYRWGSDLPASQPGGKPVHEVKPIAISQSGRLDDPSSPGNSSIAAVMDAANPQRGSPTSPVDKLPTK